MRNRLRQQGFTLVSGFTLVELLVVIGIIGVLISILLPSLSKAREQAKQTACQSQLRQLGVGIMIYAQANRSWIPAWSGWHTVDGDGVTAPDEPGPAWTEQLASSYVRPDNKIYNCPSFPVEPKINYFLTARFSATRVPMMHSMKIDDVKLSSRFVMAGDCTQVSLYPAPFGISGATTDDADKDDATQRGCVWRNEPGGVNIHKNGNNLLFADGHVAVYPQFVPSEITFHPKVNGVDWENVASAAMP